MKILHTADWHLGQKFLSRDRIEEHQGALDWIRTTIVEQEVEVLLVSGDLFDIGNPPSCLLYTSPSPRDATLSRMPSSA